MTTDLVGLTHTNGITRYNYNPTPINSNVNKGLSEVLSLRV